MRRLASASGSLTRQRNKKNQNRAATASATISSGRDGSAASATASSVQPLAAVSACRRRSRASITAMTTSSRCKPSPPYRCSCGQSLARACRGVIMEHADESVSWCGGACTVSARQRHSTVGRTLKSAALGRCAVAAPRGGVWRTMRAAMRAARTSCAAIRQYAMRAAQGRQASSADGSGPV